MDTYEPRQIWKEAALSEPVHVPWGSLVRANCYGNVWREMSTAGARAFNKFQQKYTDINNCINYHLSTQTIGTFNWQYYSGKRKWNGEQKCKCGAL